MLVIPASGRIRLIWKVRCRDCQEHLATLRSGRCLSCGTRAAYRSGARKPWCPGGPKPRIPKQEHFCADCGVPVSRATHRHCRQCAPRSRTRRPRYDAWSSGEIRRLRELAGASETRHIPAILNDEFHGGLPIRTVHKVQVRAAHEGISLWMRDLSPIEVGRIFGVTYHNVFDWIHRGLLEHRVCGSRGRRDHTFRVSPLQLEAFVRQHACAYNWRTMPPGRFRWLAGVTYRADPWLSCAEVGEILGVTPECVRSYLKRGMAPWRKGWAGRMMRASDLPVLRVSVERMYAAQWAAKSAAGRRRWARALAPQLA